jgi:UDP-N-acetylmuramoylalanine--D-glutamate ligase
MDYKAYFKGKKVTLMRIGLLGRGVGDAATLAECGADVLVVDDAPQEVMQPSVDKLKKYKNIKFKFGPYDINDFRNCDFVLKGAGTPLDSPEIAEARKYGIPVEMSASLFMKLANIPVIGITGTRGKSTVTHLIYHILGVAKKKVLLGGNVVGVSTLALLPKAKNADYAVFELDSWQLQGFGDSEISPQVAVFTTFMDDHLAYYKGDRNLYFKDKANIFMYQKEGDWCVVGKQVAPMMKKFKGNFITAPTSLKDFPTKLKGVHNLYNIAIAVTVARKLGIKDVIIKKAVKSFVGVPGRLELVRVVKGVSYYNDTTATTPDATIAALRALGDIKKKNIVLIMGGSDKNLSFEELLKIIPKYCKAVIFLSGTGTEKLKVAWSKMKVSAVEYNSMKYALEEAKELSKKGDIVLLSPAFASFGLFKNEYDRGEQFDKIVKKI